jgi:hypothetical protein
MICDHAQIGLYATLQKDAGLRLAASEDPIYRAED